MRARFGEEDASFFYASDPAMLNSNGNGNHAPVSADLGGAISQQQHQHVSGLLCAIDLSASLQTAVQLIFFDERRPHNMTVHLSSPEAPVAHVWTGGGWAPRPTAEVATMVMRRAAEVLFEMRRHYLFSQDDVRHFRNNLYLDVQETPPSLVRRAETIETLAMYSPLVARFHPLPLSTPSAKKRS